MSKKKERSEGGREGRRVEVNMEVGEGRRKEVRNQDGKRERRRRRKGERRCCLGLWSQIGSGQR